MTTLKEQSEKEWREKACKDHGICENAYLSGINSFKSALHEEIEKQKNSNIRVDFDGWQE